MWPHLLPVDQPHLAACDICVDPGVDNDTRTTSINQDCIPLSPPRPPKSKHMHDHNYNDNLNHIDSSGIQPLALSPTKYSRGERKDPAGTAEKEAWAMQQHLDRIGKVARLASTSLYRDHKGRRFCSFCTTPSRTAVPGRYQDFSAPSRTPPR